MRNRIFGTITLLFSIFTLTSSYVESEDEAGFKFGYLVVKEEIARIVNNSDPNLTLDYVVKSCDIIEGPCYIQTVQGNLALVNYVRVSLIKNNTYDFFFSRRNDSQYWDGAMGGYEAALVDLQLGDVSRY